MWSFGNEQVKGKLVEDKCFNCFVNFVFVIYNFQFIFVVNEGIVIFVVFL